MRFGFGRTHTEKVESLTRARELELAHSEWHPWFAWRPVRLIDIDSDGRDVYAFMESVDRRSSGWMNGCLFSSGIIWAHRKRRTPDKLRLLLFKECNRSCPGCCNNYWNLDELPVTHNFMGYKEIMLTGGEPMLDPFVVHTAIRNIRWQNKKAKIFMYTAKVDQVQATIDVLNKIDGITLTLHNRSDIIPFHSLDREIFLNNPHLAKKSLRVNVFSNVAKFNSELRHLCPWKVKWNIEWTKDCPLPDNEEFKRFPRVR